ncbi:MAG: translocation/assembly module TamB, partial [Bacteroidota bacterium]
AATFDGTTALGDLPYALKYHFNQYFSLHDTSLDRYTKPLAFTFKTILHDPKTLTEVFLPQVSRLATGVFEGTFDSEKKMLNVDAAVSTLNYDNIRIDSLSFTVRSDSARMSSVFHVKSISDSLMNITNLQLSAAIEHDSIGLTMQSTENDGEVKLFLAGIFNSVQNGYQFHFTPRGVLFQNRAWNVPPDNFIHFGKHQFIAHNVVLQGAGQSLAINSIEQTSQQPPVKIDFVNFHLGTLLQAVEQEKGLIGGVLNGNIVLRNLDKQMAFTSDLAIDSFTFRQTLVGDIMLHANNQKQNLFEVNMDLSGNGNDISLNGTFLSKVGGSILDFDLDLRSLNLAALEPFTFGQIRRLTGTAAGKMHLSGTRKKPSINGSVKFNNTAFEPDFLKSYLYINNGGIDVNEKGIRFNSFDLTDTLGNKASVTGNLFTEDFREFAFNMRIHTKHFLLMNTPPSKKELYYGTVFLNSDMTIQGDKDKPIIRIQAQLAKGTDLAVVIPESETAIQQRLDIVKFTVVRDSLDHILSRNKTGTEETIDTSITSLSGIDLTSNVEVDKQSRLRILIDPISGDSLVIRGEATFSVGIDPSGKLSVTGRYEIIEGIYQLSFGDFIKKEFVIEKGSSITWLGSATDAMFNITAMYSVKTSAIDLVQDQLAGLSPEERNKYKQELRILVHLIMDGKLLKPNIRFKLDLPPEQRGTLGGSIYAKLNEINGQESELNKQVFALLVLGRFISASPLASTGEGGFNGLARSSASQVLTEQLNRLSEEYIRGVKLNVGVESYEDYSTGSAEGRTQLQLALSKQLFDERVTVSVGGNVDLEGNRRKQNSLNNFAGDMNVGYKLTDDGRWQLQVFRQNTYEGAIEGDLVETGVGIVFTIDFDKLFGLTLKPVEDEEE